MYRLIRARPRPHQRVLRACWSSVAPASPTAACIARCAGAVRAVLPAAVLSGRRAPVQLRAFRCCAGRRYDGIKLPGEFIPAAEHSRSSSPTSVAWRTVLDSACGPFAEWQRAPACAARMFSVNVSVQQLKDAGFVKMVIRRWPARHQPTSLELELVEDPCWPWRGGRAPARHRCPGRRASALDGAVLVVLSSLPVSGTCARPFILDEVRARFRPLRPGRPSSLWRIRSENVASAEGVVGPAPFSCARAAAVARGFCWRAPCPRRRPPRSSSRAGRDQEIGDHRAAG